MSLDWSAVEHDPSVPKVEPVRRAARQERGRKRSRFRRFVLILVALPFTLSLIYALVPPVSTLMLARWATLRPVERDWVPLEEISPALPRAVIAAEDGFFCSHQGVDWGAMREVFAESWLPDRGASTISMQVAKNLFLWQGFGWVRKPIEIVLAYWLDLIWSKHRIMEVYLNVVEWGPDGIFGAGAAAQRAFGKSPERLSNREAAILAGTLPNPVVRNAARPGPRLSRRAGRIMARAGDTSCLD